MHNGIRLILLVTILTVACGSVVFLSSCLRAASPQDEQAIPGIECPARLMTDADQLWLCAYFIEEDDREIVGIQFPTNLDCCLVDCYTVHCADAAYSITETGQTYLLGTVYVEGREIDFLCI